MTDHMPDKEFHELFDRISEKIDLKGASTPAEINQRLSGKIREYGHASGTSPFASFHVENRISRLKRLIFAGFGRRAISEAIANPHGIVALTLKYGKRRAREILLKRRRKPIV